MSKRNESRPGYKKTSLGWIPKDWMISPLGSVGEFLKGKGISNSDKSSYGIPCITYGEIYTTHDYIIKEFKSFIDQRIADGSQLIIANDLLFAGSGEDIDEIGKCVVYKGSKKAFAGGDIIIFRQRKIDSIYLSYSINSDFIKRHRRKLGQGHSIVHIYSSHLKSLKVPIPPFSEQKKIAEILSAWDRAIEQTRNLIDVKMRLKKGLMQQLLTGRMRFPQFGTPVFHSSEIPHGWRKVRIGDVLKQVSRPVIFNDNHYYDLISIRRRSEGLIHRGTLRGNQIATKNLYFAKEGDFLISKMQVVHGAMGIITKPFENMYISGSYLSLIPKSEADIDIYYFDYLSRTPELYHAAYISSYGVHIEKMTFNLNLFLRNKIVIPGDIKEQNRIVTILHSVDEELEYLFLKKQSLVLQKVGLMQKLLTGEIRVTQLINH